MSRDEEGAEFKNFQGGTIYENSYYVFWLIQRTVQACAKLITKSKPMEDNMKPRTISIAAVALASGLLFNISQIARVSADDQHKRGCSNKTLKGAYGSYRTGNGSMGPAAGVGRLTFDGNGNNSGLQNISRNGTFILDNPVLGTYEVAEDCTGKFLDPMGNEVSRIVIVDDGKEFYGLSLTAGTAIYGVWKKIHNDRDR